MTEPEKIKKLINSPDDVIDELIEGMIGAHPDLLCRPGPTGRAIVSRHRPRKGKVGIVIGGGSGHESAFSGYVGKGLADAAAVGNVFASPSPEHIIDAARAAAGGAGVLFLYGNYTGDVMSFDMVGDALADEGITARSLTVTDDVASSPLRSERRGIAGGFFVFKCAGAACSGAEAGMNDTGDMIASKGRAAKLGQRSLGLVDPGAASALVILTSMRDALAEALA